MTALVYLDIIFSEGTITGKEGPIFYWSKTSGLDNRLPHCCGQFPPSFKISSSGLSLAGWSTLMFGSIHLFPLSWTKYDKRGALGLRNFSVPSH